MPASPEPSASDEAPSPGQGLAVAAESLYLINLLLLPGLAFLALLWLYFRRRDAAPPLARGHLRQTLSASLWAGALLVIANLLIVALGGYDSGWTWVVVILYFTTAHTTLVVFGILGLARALAGQPFRYPLVGNLLP
ncbi:MAG: hypothetical protein MZW92_41520 [Comamonadaceae bacterium]|jgi:uncharacterized Tic20 family protein|nr:hypothetical protein [Comamonadaceae bacterium]